MLPSEKKKGTYIHTYVTETQSNGGSNYEQTTVKNNNENNRMKVRTNQRGQKEERNRPRNAITANHPHLHKRPKRMNKGRRERK